MFASYVIYSIKQTATYKMGKYIEFASYVIYSIKQTVNIFVYHVDKFASYVIYSIKQTKIKNGLSKICLLVMLFIVLSKLL